MLKDSRIKYLVISKSLRYFLLNCNFDIVQAMTQEFRGRFISGFKLYKRKKERKKLLLLFLLCQLMGGGGGGDIGVPRA